MPSLVSQKRRAQGWRSEGETFERSDLRSLDAPLSRWIRPTFRAAKLGLANLTGAYLEGAVFTDCEMPLANFTGATISGMRLHGCDLEQARFNGAVIKDAVFDCCRMAYSSLAGATLVNCRFARCSLHGADLDIIESARLVFEDSNLWGAKVAIGCGVFNAEFDERTCNYFAAMLARIHPGRREAGMLRAVAGEYYYAAVDRLMRPAPEPQMALFEAAG